MNLLIRKANAADTDFILEAIIASEKSGTDTLSYCKIFSISEPEACALIHQILEEEIEGQEWCILHYWIAEIDGVPVSCLSAWVEGEVGKPSGILKAEAMSYILGNVWQASQENLQGVSKVQIGRISHALQLENIYTVPTQRGAGIARKLIHEVIKQFKKQHPNMVQAEIQLMGNNQTALQSYTQCGFLSRAKSQILDDANLHLLPGAYKISLVKSV